MESVLPFPKNYFGGISSVLVAVLNFICTQTIQIRGRIKSFTKETIYFHFLLFQILCKFGRGLAFIVLGIRLSFLSSCNRYLPHFDKAKMQTMTYLRIGTARVWHIVRIERHHMSEHIGLPDSICNGKVLIMIDSMNLF